MPHAGYAYVTRASILGTSRSLNLEMVKCRFHGKVPNRRSLDIHAMEQKDDLFLVGQR